MRKSLSVLLVITLSLFSVFCIAEAESFSNNPDLIEQAVLSVLKLYTYDIFGDPVATGSGFVMFDNMTLITNYHVMEDAYTMMAESDEGYQYYITGIKAADKDKDIAIMQFSAPTVMTPLSYSTAEIKRGERVTAIGSPVGLKNTVSMGNISAVFQEAGVSWIQTTAPISHGSSGGALINEKAEVVGITSATRSDGQNINFAVNITEAVSMYRTWNHGVLKLGQQTGFADMLCDQGDKYYWGEKEEENFNLAAKYYEKAAELGNIRAIYMLGRCYYRGNGFKQDKEKAIKYLSRAAELGNLDAIDLLGDCYFYGTGTLQDTVKAKELYLQAAKLGNVEAMNDLADYYMFREIQYEQAYYWAQKSALLGNPLGMSLSGLLYENGWGIALDQKTAFEWYKKSAELGFALGMECVGNCYRYGIGVQADKTKMIEWYSKAAEQDDLVGDSLAVCYYFGDGVTSDVMKAYELAQKAAEQESTTAMILLGLIFEHGSNDIAKEWYQKALDLGDENAQQYLNNLNQGRKN